MAETRREKFLQSSKDAAEALNKAKAEFAAIQAKFNTLEAELQEFKTNSESQAKQDAEKITQEGEKLANQISSETKRIATEEIAKARYLLREELMSAAKKKAEQTILETLNESEKNRILSARVTDLKNYQVQ